MEPELTTELREALGKLIEQEELQTEGVLRWTLQKSYECLGRDRLMKVLNEISNRLASMPERDVDHP
jgi:hypothetical protein